MTTELTEKVSWLTTVAKSGQPVPRLVWFGFDGTELFVYSEPEAAKARIRIERVWTTPSPQLG